MLRVEESYHMFVDTIRPTWGKQSVNRGPELCQHQTVNTLNQVAIKCSQTKKQMISWTSD